MNSAVQIIGRWHDLKKEAIYKLLIGDSCIYWFMVEEDKKVRFSADAVSYLLDANPVASEESLEKQRDTRKPGKEKE